MTPEHHDHDIASIAYQCMMVYLTSEWLFNVKSQPNLTTYIKSLISEMKNEVINLNIYDKFIKIMKTQSHSQITFTRKSE